MAYVRLEDVVAARVSALRSVLYPDSDYFWRKLTRWACDRLNISIFEAESMPIDILLRHYYECRIEEMEDDERNQWLREATETEEERRERELKAEEEKEQIDQFEAMVRAEAEAANKREGRPVISAEEAAKLQEKANKPQNYPNIDLHSLPPDFSVKFEEPEDGEGDWDLFGKPPK